MSVNSYCQMYLSCESAEEASKITRALLEKRLIVCAKQIPITSDFWWKGNIDHSSEILLIMESRTDLFDEIEAEVAKLHSYETFVLQAIPIIKLSKGAEQWMRENLKG